MFTCSALHSLGHRASTIDERVACLGSRQSVVPRGDYAHTRLLKWRLWAANNDTELFRRRLELDGLTEDSALYLATSGMIPPDGQGAAWADSFAWIAKALSVPLAREILPPFFVAAEPMPFEHLFDGVVRDASARAGLSSSFPGFHESAISALQRILLRRLTTVAAPTIFQHFELFRIFGQDAAQRGTFTGHDTYSRRTYDSFISTLKQSDQLQSLIEQAPVLARLLTTISENWIAATREFLYRFESDRSVLPVALNDGKSLGEVTDIEGDLSDPHQGGRTIWKLTFSDGSVVGYKPRSLGLDHAWHELLQWLSRHGAPPLCGAPKVFPRPGYGWVQWITSHPCTDILEFNRYFRRAGSMLCLLHFLGGSDFHAENIIAHGSIPFPIDLETLLQPWLPNLSLLCANGTATAGVARRLRESVLSTHFLPSWTIRPDDVLIKTGGLNPNNVKAADSIGYREVNTDNMQPIPHRRANEQPSNLPHYKATSANPTDYCCDLEEGFEAMYRFLMEHRSAVLHPSGPVSNFCGQPVRVVLRSTMLYTFLLDQSVRPQSLSNGLDWSLHFEYLTRWYALDSFGRNERWAIQKEERASLSMLDVPYFTSYTDSRDLHLPSGSIVEDYFEITGMDRLHRKSALMDEEDLEQQLEYIRHACRSGELVQSEASAKVSPRDLLRRAVFLTKREAIQLACEIGETICEEAHLEGDAAAWIGATLLPGDQKANFEVTGQSLYSGGAGIGLFLASLYSCTGASRYREIALAAFNSVRQEMQAPDRFARTMGIGGACGLGSIIYGLSRSATMLEESRLLDDATALSTLVSDVLISSDNAFDVMAGSGGAILGLLALEAARPNEGALDRAVACGRHLISKQVPCPAGGHAWRTVGGQILTGMSHGAAGIALALQRLHHETADDGFLSAAQRAITYERNMFSPSVRNWPDLRGGRKQGITYRYQWCHGAVGIGLARLGCLDLFDDEKSRIELDSAIDTTLQNPLAQNDSMCCGTFGCIDFLYTAGCRQERTDLISAAHSIARHTIDAANTRGRFLFHLGSNRQNPSLFTGISGVGYELLRLTESGAIPSVLLWE